MTLKTRRIIYIIFILIFLLAAPAILLYTAGYNYNFKKGGFLKTGVILIDAVPADAQFLIDGKNYNLSLPARVSNLKPKDYTVTLKRDGYYDWKKTLSVEPSETIFATNVFLPKKSTPELVLETNISQSVFLEKSNQFILVVRRGKTSQIILFDATNKQKTILIDTLTEKNPILTISPNEKYLLLETTRQTLAINLSKPSATVLLQGKNGPLRKTVFEADNDFVVYGLDGQLLVRRNLITDEQRTLYTISGNNFLLHNGFLYWTATLGDQPFSLQRIALFVGNRENPKPIVNVPRGNYKIKPVGNNILLHELGTNFFSLIDTETHKSLLDGQMLNFIPRDRNSLIYWNTSEIWLNNLDDKNTRLVTRIGEPIIKAIELQKQPYVLYATTNGISLIEEDNRNTKNTYSLYNGSNIKDLFLFKDTIAYFIGDKGIYLLTLQ